MKYHFTCTGCKVVDTVDEADRKMTEESHLNCGGGVIWHICGDCKKYHPYIVEKEYTGRGMCWHHGELVGDGGTGENCFSKRRR